MQFSFWVVLAYDKIQALNYLEIISKDHEQDQRRFAEYNLITAFTNHWLTTNDYVVQRVAKPHDVAHTVECDDYLFLFQVEPV